VDIGPMIPAVRDFSTVYTGILEAVLQDENVDALFNVMWADARGKNEKAYLEAYEALKGLVPKPVVTWIYGPNPSSVRTLKERVEGLGYPVFDEPERCVTALGMAYRYTQIRKNGGR
jgi:acyl-CoA synthetase (NDP forming)